MRALLVVMLVALALGGAAFLFLVRSGDERGRDGGSSARGPLPDPRAHEQLNTVTQQARTLAPAVDRHTVQTLAAPDARGILEGTVIGDGAPLPGAKVELHVEERVLGDAQSDEHGRFHLEFPPLTAAGTLRFAARGYVALERVVPARPAGGTTLLGNVRLPHGQRIVGRVVDGRGNPVADAEVRVEPTDPGSDVLVGLGRSGPDGSFAVDDAPPATVAVTVRASGFGEQLVRYTPGADPFLIRLEPGTTLRLVVRTSRGAPVSGAEVAIQSQNDVRIPKRSKRTDENGRVAFEGLGTRNWTARVSHPDYRPSGGQFAADGAEHPVQCDPWPAIEGTVRAPEGSTLPPGTRVLALPAATPGDHIGPIEGGAEVAADGHFRLGGLRPGDWRVRAFAPGLAPATSGPVRLGIDGDGFAGTIQLTAGGRLVLSVALDGAPVANAELELLPNEPAPYQLYALQGSRGSELGRRITSGADGLATFDSLPAGRVWVGVYAEGSPPLSAGPFDVAGDGSAGPSSVRLERGARVAGRVLAKSGAPLDGAQLRILETVKHLGFPLTLASDAEGRYTSAWLPPGRYTIEAFSPQDPTQRSGSTELDLAAGEQRNLDLTL